ncbi:MAG: biotin/lipoyl-containing protein, partial [Vicinamibacteria bacterium]
MGDSVTEGTVLEWHKKEGDSISADETLVEISTDKVDAEVPAPVTGKVVRLLVAEGDTVEVGAALAEIDPSGGNGASPSSGAAPAEPAEPAAPAADEAAAAEQKQVEITMPQMGESVTEGVILEWHKQPGDSVEADET